MRIDELKLNADNPRVIKDAKFEQLTRSIICFPQMLRLRGIVYNAEKVIIAGNRRYNSIVEINKRGVEFVEKTLKNAIEFGSTPAYQKDGSPTLQANLEELEPIFRGELRDEWLINAELLTDEQELEFVVKDNTHYGDWDYETLANEWTDILQDDWGLDLWKPDANENPIDFSEFEDEASDEAENMMGGVMRGIQIPFQPEHYEEAYKLVKFWLDKGLYLGGFLIEKLKEEKLKSNERS